jgi:hypothetical protein
MAYQAVSRIGKIVDSGTIHRAVAPGKQPQENRP